MNGAVYLPTACFCLGALGLAAGPAVPTSISLRFISVAGIRPMPKQKSRIAGMHARSPSFLLGRTAHCLREKNRLGPYPLDASLFVVLRFCFVCVREGGLLAVHVAGDGFPCVLRL